MSIKFVPEMQFFLLCFILSCISNSLNRLKVFGCSKDRECDLNSKSSNGICKYTSTLSDSFLTFALRKTLQDIFPVMGEIPQSLYWSFPC